MMQNMDIYTLGYRMHPESVLRIRVRQVRILRTQIRSHHEKMCVDCGGVYMAISSVFLGGGTIYNRTPSFTVMVRSGCRQPEKEPSEELN